MSLGPSPSPAGTAAGGDTIAWPGGSPARKETPLPRTPCPRPSRLPLTGAHVALVGVAILAALLLAACGSSGTGGSSADPAGAVPAGAVLYTGAILRPAGTLKSNALSAAGALTHQADPYERLVGLLRTPGSAPLSFSHDVSPWLGPDGGVFLSSFKDAGALATLLEHGLLGDAGASTFPFTRGGPQGAIVLDTSDASRAQSFLKAQAARAGALSARFEGVPYEANGEGVAFMLLHGLVVIGSEAAVHSVIQTVHDGHALARSSAYARLARAAPAGALAHVYLDARAAAEAGARQGAGPLGGLLAGAATANVSLVPERSSLSLDLDSTASSASPTGGGLLAFNPQSAKAFDELPGESWLAIGLGHLGSALPGDVAGLKAIASLLTGSASSSALSLGSLVQGMLLPLEALGANTAQARSEYTSWMGSGGVFASGSSLLELRGAVVISSTNPARSRAAVASLAAQLRAGGARVSSVSIPGTEAAVRAAISGLPLPLAIADGRDGSGQSKFVIGLGEASVPAALSPASTMSAASTRAGAASSLGEGIEPSAILEVPSLLGLLEGVGLLEGPPLAQLVPYLRSMSTLAAGGRGLGGGAERTRVVLGL